MSSAGADGRDDGLVGVRPLAPGDPRRIGPYALLGRLGAGGMGRVFLARSAGGRTVAVKVVHEQHASDDHFRARFRREINAARRVGERYTAPVLDADLDAELPWVATGYVPGPSLEHVVRQYGPLPADSVRVLADGLLRALKDIHAAGIVHRDLKPSNVMLTVEGPRVIDFGIARALDASVESLLTSTGMVIGSPGFMSPEQILGQEVGVASDVFTLGCVLMYAATGQLPFGQDVTNQHAVMYRIVEGEPHLDAVSDQALRKLVGRCLTKDPEQRPVVDALLQTAGQERPAGGEWLPAKLVVALAQQAARLLDADAGVAAEAEAPDGGPVGGAAQAGAASGGDRPTVGLRADGGAPGGAPQRVPTEVSSQARPAVPQEGLPERSARTTPARSAERERRRRPLVVGVGLVAVVTVGGGAVFVLQPFQRQQASPPANGRSAAPVNPGAPAPSSPSPAHSKDAKQPQDSGGGAPGGGSAGSSAATVGAGGAGTNGGNGGTSRGGTASSGGATGGGSPGGSVGGNNTATGGGSGSGSGSGPDSGGNAVPTSFVGTWHLTNPYAQQPGKVVISRAADGQQAVRLISDVTGTGHCENVARLESVSAGGSRINLSAAPVDQARSSGICGTADPSYFALDDPGGIRHDVGPAHGNGYHYERAN
ncbi:serine/threonine-protein kinase [Streptomyces sp. NPDC090442]|uniref:serine/threonine-protein kinase n=1 Tax=Streptomyces sp. NPDC090442 TaxID=3365962 RepID=UPI0038069F02